MSKWINWPHKRVAVCVFIRNAEGHYLLMRRHDCAERQPGMWMVPGGIMHVGETVEQAARRECMEEIGCELDSVTLLDVLLDVGPDFVLVLMGATLRAGQKPRHMEPDKHGPPIWMDTEMIEGVRDDGRMPASQMHWFGGKRGLL